MNVRRYNSAAPETNTDQEGEEIDHGRDFEMFPIPTPALV
jgi:hypothetical protein